MTLSISIIYVALFFMFVLCFVSRGAYEGGFSVELVHRDSPRSPLYDPSDSPIQRLEKSLSRTLKHSTSLNRSGDGDEPFTGIFSGGGSFLMNISIGTPPFKILAVADTGSDLIWTQCKPCNNCFKQTAPLFDPRGSSTYRDISCTSRKCTSMGQTSCDPTQRKACWYSYSYGGQSHTHGNAAVETVMLSSTSGRPITFPETLIGCGHDNYGSFDEKMSGIVGLGGGPISLVSQMGKAAGGKFSYCLVPYGSEKSSRLNFGSRAAVTGPGTVSTSFSQDSHGTFYYLNLQAISVGEITIENTGPSSLAADGNIIIDSGTTLTFLPENFYSHIESQVAKAIKLKPMPNPPIKSVKLCYGTLSNARIPLITAHFAGGADIRLGTLNTFMRIGDDAVCFAFAPSSDGVSIYGNVAQMNFLVGYDIANKEVSFKPTDCTK